MYHTRRTPEIGIAKMVCYYHRCTLTLGIVLLNQQIAIRDLLYRLFSTPNGDREKLSNHWLNLLHIDCKLNNNWIVCWVFFPVIFICLQIADYYEIHWMAISMNFYSQKYENVIWYKIYKWNNVKQFRMYQQIYLVTSL